MQVERDGEAPRLHDLLPLGLQLGVRLARRHRRRVVVEDVELGLDQLGPRITGGIRQPAPVGVLPIPGGFYEQRVADRPGHLFGILGGSRSRHLHFHDLGDFLAIRDYLVRQRLARLPHRLGEEHPQFARALVAHADAGVPVGQNQHGVVGAHVTVHRDAVERAGDGLREGFLQKAAGHGKVGREEGQHRRHVGLDHAGALRDAGNEVSLAVVGEADGHGLGPRIGSQDGAGGLVPVVGGAAFLGHRALQALDQARHGHRLADAPGRTHEKG